MTVFGDLQPLCSHVPSYYLCNLFYRQARSCYFLNSACILTSTLQLIDNGDRDVLTGLSQNQVSAPVGINPECGTLRVGQNGSLGNIANIVVCGLSFFFTLALFGFSCLSSLGLFANERILFMRERSVILPQTAILAH